VPELRGERPVTSNDQAIIEAPVPRQPRQHSWQHRKIFFLRQPTGVQQQEGVFTTAHAAHELTPFAVSVVAATERLEVHPHGANMEAIAQPLRKKPPHLRGNIIGSRHMKIKSWYIA